MAVEVVFVPNPIQERHPHLARQFEQVVLDVLRGHDGADPGPFQVRFHVWEGDEVPKYVCKVECPSVRTIDMLEPPWRWWSPLVETPLELTEELRDALRARQARRRAAARDEVARDTLAPAAHWGWGVELSLR